ncbi:hypothetical protein [Amycolatopsis sp. lyj-112]|uniref:hypothetical protein n=1 Tax=Amycolatopsis sp. lyj-112 TaxID=2789288 RepID=UPI00397D73F7
MSLNLVIFDYKTLLSLQPGTDRARAAREMLNWTKGQGLQWCLFSTNPLTGRQQLHLEQLGYPPADLLVNQNDIISGKRRGSPDWITAVTTATTLEYHNLLYVGSTAMDWRTAINSGVMYLHADWVGAAPSGTTSLVAESPQSIPHFINTFLTGPSIWSHRLDSNSWALRSLLPASASLPCSSGTGRFSLQDVFTYDKEIKIGEDDARDVLMLFALTSAYREGLLPPNPYICVYPSSKKGKVSAQLKDYLDKAAKLFHGYYRDDLLVRAVEAPDTSLERWRAKSEGRQANVSIATQAQTVHLGAKYHERLTGRTVVVFDDFTTNGMSLEWARLLLVAAGAGRIVMVTLGKYGNNHAHYEIKEGTPLQPYSLNTLTADSFDVTYIQPTVTSDAAAKLHALMTSKINSEQP